MSPLELIKSFLGIKRFAFIGVSRNPKDFSVMLLSDLEKRGFDVARVNPLATELYGKPCFRSITEITPPVSTALVMLPKTAIRQVLDECKKTGIRLVWLYGVTGPREFDKDVLSYAAQLGLDVIPGYCPYMFLKDAMFFHRAHGFVARMIGMYPR